MDDLWSDADAARYVERWGAPWGTDLALRVYSSRLLGGEPDLVLHGGGNTSLKGSATDLFGRQRPVLFIKASGHDLAAASPADFPAADRELLAPAGAAWGEADDDVRFRRALRAALLDPDAPTPSIEAPVHAVLPGRYVDHTHADAVLALTNREDGAAVVAAALGEEVVVLPYVTPGRPLARAVAAAVGDLPPEQRAAGAMVWLHHGLVTWGETAEASYRRMIELVQGAETYLERERAAGRRVDSARGCPVHNPDHRDRRSALGTAGAPAARPAGVAVRRPGPPMAARGPAPGRQRGNPGRAGPAGPAGTRRGRAAHRRPPDSHRPRAAPRRRPRRSPTLPRGSYDRRSVGCRPWRARPAVGRR